jgi:hypothetical protein
VAFDLGVEVGRELSSMLTLSSGSPTSSNVRGDSSMILYLESADVLSIEPYRFGRRAGTGRGEAGRKVQKLKIADFEDCGLASCCRPDVRRKVQKLKIGDSSDS